MKESTYDEITEIFSGRVEDTFSRWHILEQFCLYFRPQGHLCSRFIPSLVRIILHRNKIQFRLYPTNEGWFICSARVSIGSVSRYQVYLLGMLFR